MTGRPDPVRRLADADAGLPDPATAARVRADLAALPSPPVPDDVAARWDAALAAAAQDPPSATGESHVPTPRVARLDSASRTVPQPEPGLRGRLALLVAAAVLVVSVAAAGLLAEPERPVALARVDLAAAAHSAVGVEDLGGLADPRRRAACLDAIGLAPSAANRVLGGRGVLLDGAPGTLLVLVTGELGHLRIIVVDPACGAHGRGTLLAETVTR